ncbi:MAG: hypothetical protein ABH825_03160 [Candidatus Omnitrophota bacterium]
MQKSTALALVLSFMVIMGLGTTAVLQAMISYANMNVTNTDRIKARYLAEGYLHRAAWEIRNGDTSEYDAKEGKIDIYVTKTEETPGSGVYRVKVRGHWPGF